MHWQRAIFQAAADPDPANAILMHDEWLIASDCVIALCVFCGFIIRRFGFSEIRNIQACPFLLFFAPPDELFTFAPWLAIRTSRSAVVKNPPIARPCVTPAMAIAAFRFTFERFVLVA